MDIDIETVPMWAYSWCYYFAGLALVSVIAGVILPFATKMGLAPSIMYMIGAAINAATMATMFWICRSSLKPAAASTA